MYQLLTPVSLVVLPQGYPVCPTIPLHLLHQYHGVNSKYALHWLLLKNQTN